MERVDPPYLGDERSQLDAWLEFHRATVRVKCAGLAEADAWKTPLPSSLLVSAGGLVSHLMWVERNWFERVMVGRDYEVPWTEADPDADFRGLPGETLAGVLTRYEAQCEVSREIARGLDLDALGRWRDQDVSLRWVYLHMIEETARHNGHLDAVRELVDGVVGE